MLSLDQQRIMIGVPMHGRSSRLFTGPRTQPPACSFRNPAPTETTCPAPSFVLKQPKLVQSPHINISKDGIQALFPRRTPTRPLVSATMPRWWGLDLQAIRTAYSSFQVVMAFEVDGHILQRRTLVDLRFFPGRQSVRVHNHQACDVLQGRILTGWRRDSGSQLVAIITSPPGSPPLPACTTPGIARMPRSLRRADRLLARALPEGSDPSAIVEEATSHPPCADPPQLSGPGQTDAPPAEAQRLPRGSFCKAQLSVTQQLLHQASSMPWYHMTSSDYVQPYLPSNAPTQQPTPSPTDMFPLPTAGRMADALQTMSVEELPPLTDASLARQALTTTAQQASPLTAASMAGALPAMHMQIPAPLDPVCAVGAMPAVSAMAADSARNSLESRARRRTYVPARLRPVMSELYVPFGLWRDLFDGSDRPFPAGGLALRIAVTGVVQMAEQPATLVRRVTPYGYYVLRGLKGLARLKGKLMLRWSLLVNGVVELEIGAPGGEDKTATKASAHTPAAPAAGSIRPAAPGSNIVPMPGLRRLHIHPGPATYHSFT